MQKVITSVVFPGSKGFAYDKGLAEQEHPEVNKLLSEGFEVKQVLSSITTLGNSAAVVTTFILHK